ncbi:tRNA (adenosine(37)-N6)-threonylcarbamoyltransferase complex dimerization subunit type 1 TsaB, partial [Candidatus Peregrinibacteria bacterium RIFOXYB2_FULL_32_7]
MKKKLLKGNKLFILMLTLAINTALNLNQIVLFDDKKILGEKIWTNDKRSNDIFLDNFKNLLKTTKKEKTEIKQIFIITGPGPYVSLRVGIVIANAFAYGLNIPIFGLNIFDFIKETNGFDLFDLLILNASKEEIFIFNKNKKEMEIIKFKDLIKNLNKFKNLKIVENLTDKQKENIVRDADLRSLQYFPFSNLLLRLN